MKNMRSFCGLICVSMLLMTISAPHALARESGTKTKFLDRIIQKKIQERQEKQEKEGSKEGFYKRGTGQSINETLGARSFITYLPKTYQSDNHARPLLIVLHGGMGSAAQIKNYIGLDPLADQHDFVLAYLDGTQVARKLSDRFKGWNAGECCGVPKDENIDDIGYISDVIDYMHKTYNIDKSKIYGTGHSNGAMMTQRVICETDLYKDAITMSGTLQMDVETCPHAKGSRLMNIHGSEDKNLPPEGGHSTEGINKRTQYTSQEFTQDVFKKSGLNYEPLLLNGADHSPNTLNEGLIKQRGQTLPETIIDYLGLDK